MRSSNLPGQYAAADGLRQAVSDYVGLQEGEQVVCPRARSDFTPCVARDGASAVADDGACVGCWGDPLDLLRQLRERIGDRT